jgi:hypothetical protein
MTDSQDGLAGSVARINQELIKENLELIEQRDRALRILELKRKQMDQATKRHRELASLAADLAMKLEQATPLFYDDPGKTNC